MSIPSAANGPAAPHDMGPSPNPPSGSGSNTLFSSEEAKFLTESLSSAESFDPFTIGAPGFKVPNLLPPNLAANQVDHLHHLQQQQQQQQPPHQFPRSLSNQGGAWPASSSASAAHILPTATDAGLGLAFAGPPGAAMDMRAIADSMRFKGTESPSALGGLPHQLAAAASSSANIGSDHPYSTHRVSSWSMYGPRSSAPNSQELPASTSASHPDRHDATSTGYGKNRAWQLEQLSFLEAQANAASRRHLQQQEANKSGNRSSADLSMLGANFPSSHSFPAHDQLNQDPNTIPSHSHLHGMMMSDAGLNRVSTQVNGNTTPKDSQTTPTPGGKRMWGSFSGEKRAADGSPVDGSNASPLGRYGLDAKNRGRSPSARPAWAASSSTPPGARSDSNSNGANARRADPNAALNTAMGELAHLELDLDAASMRLPATLTEYFAPTLTEKRMQPHLELLRQEHFENGLIDEHGKEINKSGNEEKETKKQGHVLLTEAEKKANHIASEQKRRANIRKGYELLCEIVPPLKEALEREARKEKERGSEDEDDADKKKGKKKRDADTSTGCEIDGEKIDGRAGPRSEAVVLMKCECFLKQE